MCTINYPERITIDFEINKNEIKEKYFYEKPNEY